MFFRERTQRALCKFLFRCPILCHFWTPQAAGKCLLRLAVVFVKHRKSKTAGLIFLVPSRIIVWKLRILEIFTVLVSLYWSRNNYYEDTVTLCPINEENLSLKVWHMEHIYGKFKLSLWKLVHNSNIIYSLTWWNNNGVSLHITHWKLPQRIRAYFRSNVLLYCDTQNFN